MDLSIQKAKEKLYCSIRQEWVVAEPEERVRQGMITLLTDKLGFPKSAIAVEKALNQMPHLTNSEKELPDRRADIVCFAKGINPDYDLYPLLLIECKAVALTDKTIQQVLGYNHYLKSVYIAIANETDIKMGWFDLEKKEYVYIPYIPDYHLLMRSISL